MAGDINGREYSSKAWVFREGDAADGAYVVLDGSVRIFKSRNGHETTLATLKTGDIFGEMALLDGKPRSASARAGEGGLTVRYIPPAEFRAMLSDTFAWELVTEMGRRLRAADDEINRLESDQAARHQFLESRGLRRDWAV